MPFIPHTEQQREQMLAAIGVATIEELFDEIPTALRGNGLAGLGRGMTEMEIGRLMRERSHRDGEPLLFIGAGAYQHHIPAAVWEIATRGEFYSAYTPYQAEASQGTLQLLYEFQTMIASLLGMEVANASLYDGASALAEAVLMAVRANRKSQSKRILIPSTVHPVYRKVVRSVVLNQGIELLELPYCTECGNTPVESLERFRGEDITAVVVPQPNFFGVLEEVDGLTDWAHEQGALVIGLVNPVAMATLAPPGEWGAAGADIACSEGQPLGIPLSSGGPYIGLLGCKQKLVRQMPGRIIGRTVDSAGKSGFTLTLQAREQHIRRSRATSNICTNQGLMATAATLYMSLLGPRGLEAVALNSHHNCNQLLERLCAIDGVERQFDRPFFHEAVVRLNEPVDEVLRALAAQDLIGGYDLGRDYPELAGCLLTCATEVRSEEEIVRYADHLQRILDRRHRTPVCSRLRPESLPEPQQG